MRKLIFLSAAALLAGCVTPATVPSYDIQASFDAAAAKAQLAEGPNTIKGSALIRQQGGGVVTCAGQQVYLIPATAYATERIRALYGNTERGINAARRNYRFNPDPPEYLSLVRTTRCDAQGSFTFERVADGPFYVSTQVSWTVANSLQGGNLMHFVSVKGGQTGSVVLSP